jgi:hypothetical protein
MVVIVVTTNNIAPKVSTCWTPVHQSLGISHYCFVTSYLKNTSNDLKHTYIP